MTGQTKIGVLESVVVVLHTYQFETRFVCPLVSDTYSSHLPRQSRRSMRYYVSHGRMDVSYSLHTEEYLGGFSGIKHKSR